MNLPNHHLIPWCQEVMFQKRPVNTRALLSEYFSDGPGKINIPSTHRKLDLFLSLSQSIKTSKDENWI